REGKVLHVASSNYTPDMLRTANELAEAGDRPRFCGTQLEWNMLNRDVERDVVPAARSLQLGMVPYFPLASGMLTGKYRRGEPFPEGSRLDTMAYFTSVLTDENFDRVEALTAFAEERNHTILEL